MTIGEINQLIWDIDNEKDILQYMTANGLSMWLITRYGIYLSLLQKHIFSENENTQHAVKSSIIKQVRRKIKHQGYLQQSAKHSPLNIQSEYDCLNFYKGSAVVHRGEIFSSRITGFASEIKGLNTLNVIESDKHTFKKEYEGDYCYFDDLLVRSARITEKLSYRSILVINAFMVILQKHLGRLLKQNDFINLENSLKTIVTQVVSFEKLVKECFQKTEPKLVLVEDGHLGYWAQASVIKAANEKEIDTAEVQHGLMDLGFRYGEKLLAEPEFKKHKPTYCLTFGDYFTRFISSSSINKSIGYHYLESKSNTTGNIKKKHDQAVLLFISQHRYTNPIIPILYKALERFQSAFQLVIKLHPLENGETAHFESLRSFAGTRFEQQRDMYELIEEADFIIGSYSTVLLECVYFGKNPLVHRNTVSDEIIPSNLGQRFNDADELLSLLQNKKYSSLSKEQVRYFWEPDCKHNFLDFLKQTAII